MNARKPGETFPDYKRRLEVEKANRAQALRGKWLHINGRGRDWHGTDVAGRPK